MNSLKSDIDLGIHAMSYLKLQQRRASPAELLGLDVVAIATR
jgi:hypothetical protein